MAKLPSKPNLRQLGNQAKDLVKAHRAGDEATARRIGANLPRLAGIEAEDILAAKFTLQEAQHVIAREYGFQSWTRLASFVKAMEARRELEIPDQVWNEMDKALAKSEDGASEEDTYVKKPVDIKIKTEDAEYRISQVVEIQLWNTPEEREEGNSYHHGISLNIEDSTGSSEPVEEKQAWNTADQTRAALGELHAVFVKRLSAVLTQTMGIEVEILSLAVNHMDYLDFVESDDQICTYCFDLLPSGAKAAIKMPFSLACSFLDRRPADGDLEAAEQEALDRLVRLMLDELRPCWPPRVGATCADLVFCPNLHHIQIAGYDEKGVSASFVVRSERASKFFHLFYPRETIEEVVPLLEGKT